MIMARINYPKDISIGLDPTVPTPVRISTTAQAAGSRLPAAV
jgi:hypothetical protein